MKPFYLLVISLAALGLGACVLGTPTPAFTPTTQPELTATPAPTSILPSSGTSPTTSTVQRTPRQYSRVPDITIDTSARYSAVFRTSKGSFTAELFPAEAPVTVNSFIFLAREGFYNGLTFHRVIENFMIQGGDPAGTGQGGPGYQYADEIAPGLSFSSPGVLAMANRGGGTGTNGSQFFITTVPTPHLDGNHTIFGRVTQGQSVVDAISRARTGAADRPLSPVVIQSIDISSGPG